MGFSSKNEDIGEIMKINKNTLKKFEIGDEISDKELLELLEFYTNIEESLRFLGVKFHFAWRSCFDNKMRLEDYKIARKL
jgi:hypothetical protein